MDRITSHPKIPVIKVLILAVILVTVSNHNTPLLAAHKSKKNEDKNQHEQQQDLQICIDESMQTLLSGDLNFSNPDPISYCFDQLLNNNAGNNTNGGSGNNNEISNNSTFYNV